MVTNLLRPSFRRTLLLAALRVFRRGSLTPTAAEQQ
jgi:hypothetical protein